jgi:hypothetical protein
MKRTYKGITLVDIMVAASIIIIIASIIVPIAIGYSQNKQKLSSGTIENKWYEPGSTYYYQSGKILTPIETPDKWYFTISNGDSTDTFSVGEDVYNDYEIGDEYPKEKEQT